ncbi:uncharacterized protein LOC124419544 [Lucilia cuprina]|uniref:uncharacterized protein LOC124419544 n=1 Tax=Lucilia cuprina TaxID=7375 RepID=UPI000C71AE27|nr:uncharacterized protein LOC124419544 [Lucilia cuprina]
MLFITTCRFLPNAEGKSPAELMRDRPIRTVWTQLLESSKELQQQSSTSAKYQINDTVYVKNLGKGMKWIPGIIQTRIGKVVFMASTEKGICKRHINQKKPRSFPVTDPGQLSANDEVSQPPTSILPSSTSQPPTFKAASPEMISSHQEADRNQQNLQIRRTAMNRREVLRYQPYNFRKH